MDEEKYIAAALTSRRQTGTDPAPVPLHLTHLQPLLIVSFPFRLTSYLLQHLAVLPDMVYGIHKSARFPYLPQRKLRPGDRQIMVFPHFLHEREQMV